MKPRHESRLPPGRQPYDAMNGARVGAIAGAALGALVTVLTTFTHAWLVVLGAGIGAVAGYRWERSRIRSGGPGPD